MREATINRHSSNDSQVTSKIGILKHPKLKMTQVCDGLNLIFTTNVVAKHERGDSDEASLT